MDKSTLLAPRLIEADVELDGVGTVRVRALNRAEAMIVQGVKGTEATERKVITLGLVDPQLDEHEVGEWYKVAPAGELQQVAQAIAKLSGMLEDSAKAAYKSDGDDAGA